MPAPRIVVYTPSHAPLYLDECHASLRAQTLKSWMWFVVLNNGAKWAPAVPDPRVMVITGQNITGVGAAKRLACLSPPCPDSEILVELDHDDLLAPTALARVAKAFADHRDVGFVYSDCAQINADGSANLDRFDEGHGWEYRPATVAGRQVLGLKALEPLPHNLSYIWYAPNHLRAFRRSVYERAGGHDATLDVLDDQDLMARLYRVAPFLHLPAVLYLQRIHDGNTQSDAEKNARIQTETVALYDRDIEDNALAWAGRQSLSCLDLGGAHNSPEAYTAVDRLFPPGPADRKFWMGDVFEVLAGLDDSSVGVVRAVDFLEHIRQPVRLMNELYRVLVHGGMLLSLTPSTDGRGAFMDPTHCSWWNSPAFWYYTDRSFARYVPDITCRFQVSRIVDYFPSDWHELHQIPYVQANLIAIKDGPRLGGYLNI